MTVFCAFFTLNNCQHSDCHNQHMGIPLMVIAHTSFTHFKQGGTMAAKTGNRKYQARMGAHDCIKDIWSQEHVVHLQLIAVYSTLSFYFISKSIQIKTSSISYSFHILDWCLLLADSAASKHCNFTALLYSFLFLSYRIV